MQKSLEATQVEGVYGLIQRLKQHDIALLTDEVVWVKPFKHSIINESIMAK